MFHRQIAGVTAAPPVELIEHSSHREMHATHFVRIQIGHGTPGVDPLAPKNLVDEHVAETGDHGLVEEHRFDRTSSPDESGAKRRKIHGERVGSETFGVARPGHARESSRVGDRQPATVERQSESTPSIVVGSAVGQLADWRTTVDHDATGHAEMEIDREVDRRLLRPQIHRQYFPVPSYRDHSSTGQGGVHPFDTDQRIEISDVAHPTSHHCFGRTTEEFDLQNFGHESSLAHADPRCRARLVSCQTRVVADIALTLGALAVCIGMLVAAYRMEPHWVSKDGERFIARIQVLGPHDTPDGPWREMRLHVDGNSLVAGSRGIRSSRFGGHYSVVAKSDAPPAKKQIYVISGPQRALLRLPANSRAVPTLDRMLAARISRSNPGTE